MAWIRLSDNYNDHPKFDHLSDGAFRLWHQAMGFCRTYKTDGLIPTKAIRGFKAYSPKRMRELLTPWQDGENPLWHAIEGFGVKVHDYLEWNPSKDEENDRRRSSRDQMRAIREQRRLEKHPPSPPQPVSTNTPLTAVLTARDVTGREGKDLDLEEKEDAIFERAGRLREELYPAWYAKFRHGARLRLVANSLEFQDAVTICRTWDDARIEKLARIVLTTDDDWISKTDRSFRIFATKASWADDRLRQAEQR